MHALIQAADLGMSIFDMADSMVPDERKREDGPVIKVALEVTNHFFLIYL